MRRLPIASVMFLCAAFASCRKSTTAPDGAAPPDVAPPSAAPEAGTAPAPGDAAAAAATRADAGTVDAAPSLLRAYRPPRGGTAATRFERFHSYSAPAYGVAGSPPALPIPPERIAGDPLAASGTMSYWGLDDDALARLSENAFVVLAGGDEFSFDDVAEAYRHLSRHAPIYVTSDAALHLYHLVFDGALMAIETERLGPMLARLLDALRGQATSSLDLPGIAGKAAARNLAFLDVVRRLLDPDAEIDPGVRADVEAEVAAINGHEGEATSPVFGYSEDYSQYVPRGHYTRSEALSRYFRAMMWLGRMTFLVRALEDPEPSGAVDLETARTLAAQSALIAKWLQTAQVDGTAALHAWDRIYRATAFFAGFADDLTPTEISAASERAFGEIWDAPALAEIDKLDDLRRQIASARRPGIPSGTAGDTLQAGPDRAGSPEPLEDALAATTGLRFMGRRYTPDADVMGRLAFPNVGPFTGTGRPFTLVQSAAGPVRGFARGLDVMALLGTPRAATHLDALGDSDYEKYDAALARTRTAFPEPDDPTWHSNLYWGWLDVLRETSVPTAPPTQAFQTTEAWADHRLATALASWSALRHDTVLYVEQPYAGEGSAAEPPSAPPRGFVDPYPELFAKLRALGAMTAAGLDDMGLLGDPAGTALKNALGTFDDLLARLQQIAVSEIEDRALSEADNQFLSSFADRCRLVLDRMASLSLAAAGGSGDGIAETDVRTTLVADVMTNAEAGQVLEEASGRLDLMVAVVRIPGSDDLFLAAGPTLSYFEFRWAMTDRLTDEAWRGIAGTASGPPAPAWTCSYRIPCPTP